MAKRKKHKLEWNFNYLAVIIIIIILIIWSYLFIREKKIKELEALKQKIRENEKLNFALKLKTKRTFLFIRILLIAAYFAVNIVCFINNYNGHCAQCIGTLVNYNTFIFIIISALTFAIYGSFNSFKIWWRILEIRIETLIYRKSPELKQIIKYDIEYKKQLEKEIEEIDLKYRLLL